MKRTPRSRRLRAVKVRTPGGRVVIHYEKRPYNPPSCAICKRPLQGFPKLRPKDIRKGHRPPTRIYGGYLCHQCLEKLMKDTLYNTYLAKVS
ncbi:MAG TPA: 50S ribosomal protein L34e [Thermoproteales archaeon]|nr:50S ribosomal protein L34e [Thermoproteales archaeon]